LVCVFFFFFNLVETRFIVSLDFIKEYI
jgi:hypothetical protein